MTGEEKIEAYRKRDAELAALYNTTPAVISTIKGMMGEKKTIEFILSHAKVRVKNLSQHGNANQDRLEHFKTLVAFIPKLKPEDLKEINKPLEAL